METYFGTIEQARGSLARERVLEDLRTLTRHSEDLLKATANDVSEKATAARSRLTEALERAKSSYNNLQVQTLETAKKADATIRAHPYESVGIAFGLGVLIGVLIGRR